MTPLMTPLSTEDLHSFASALVNHLRLQPSLNFRCPQCDTTSVVELALISRPVDGPAVASPPSNAEAEKDSQQPEKDTQKPHAVLENGSPKQSEAANVKKSGVSEAQEKDETLLVAREHNSMTPSSCDVVGSEPVFKVKRKSKKGEALQLAMSDISPLFGLHLPNAAKKLGISMTSLKKASRYVGLRRWPGRKVRGLKSTIDGLERTIVGQGADSGNFKVARMRSEIPKLQQELNELCHGTAAQITEKMHSPAVITTNIYRRLTSGLAPRSARKNSTGTNRPDKAKKQPNRKQQLASCSNDDPHANQPTPNADKECARPSPRKYIRSSPRRVLRSSSRLGSRNTEMKASDLEGLLPEVHDIINVAGREVPETVVQAQNGNNMTLREDLLKRKLKGKAIVKCEGSMAVTKNGNIMTPKTEIGEVGIGDEKVAVEEEVATEAEPSAKRPKTEPRCAKCGKCCS